MTPAEARTTTANFPCPTAIVVGALILICYAPIVKGMVGNWMDNPDMGHGFFVPVIAGYIVWQQKEQLQAIQPRTNWWGLVVVLLAMLQLLIGTFGVELFLSRSALVITAIGAVWFLAGTEMLRKLAFPLCLLIFMVPLPALIFNSLTFPLQIMASQLADGALTILNIPVLREGNILELPGQRLQVVEACSGIRSLLSLTFLSLVYGYFFEKRSWVRVVLFAATIPIAILANAGRVTITGILSQIKPELAQGFFHESTGWVIFMIALGVLLLFHGTVVRVVRFRDARTRAV